MSPRLLPLGFVGAVLGVAAGVPAFAAESAPKTKVDAAWHVRPIVLSYLVEFRWKRYAKPKEFQMYELLRMEPDGTETVLATTTNRYSTNGMDPAPHAGKNTYRLCARLKAGDRVCAAKMTAVYKGKNTTPLPVPKPAVEAAPPSPDAAPALFVPSADPAAVAPSEIVPAVETVELESARIEPTVVVGKDLFALSAAASGTSAVLSWGVVPMAPDYWKVLRSATNPDLAYPIDGYAAHIPDSAASSAVLRDVPMGQWLRVCAVKEDVWISCSSVVRMAP